MTDTETLTTTDIAKALDTDGRTLRRYLRTAELGVGSGSRYEFDPADVKDIKRGFRAWRNEVEATKAEEPAHTCDVCNRAFKSASGLSSHSRTHRDD